jgi:hypothetical protein
VVELVHIDEPRIVLGRLDFDVIIEAIAFLSSSSLLLQAISKISLLKQAEPKIKFSRYWISSSREIFGKLPADRIGGVRIADETIEGFEARLVLGQGHHVVAPQGA